MWHAQRFVRRAVSEVFDKVRLEVNETEGFDGTDTRFNPKTFSIP
jgi:hypothetical protein